MNLAIEQAVVANVNTSNFYAVNPRIIFTSLYLWKFHSLCLLLKLEACCPSSPPPPSQTDGPVGKAGLRSANTKHLAMLLITPNRGT